MERKVFCVNVDIFMGGCEGMLRNRDEDLCIKVIKRKKKILTALVAQVMKHKRL